VIQFNNVHLRFDTGISLRELNFAIHPQEFVYIYGPSGSGKSSILKMCYFELFPNVGSVTVLGENTSKLKRQKIAASRQKIGRVFQTSKLLDDRDIYGNLALPLELRGDKTAAIRQQVVRRADELGLRSRLSHFPTELSLGEQQRVSLARAVISKPDLLLADEPLIHLDAEYADLVLKWLWQLNQGGMTIILATNNEQLIQQEPARTLSLEAGALLEDYSA